MEIINKKSILMFTFFIGLFLLALIAQAESEAPIGLQRIQQYQQEQAQYYLQNISFFIAFLGGILSFLLPCTLAILPAFFAYTFKEKKDLTKMTFVFFLGFGLVFVILGLIAAFVGESLASFQENNRLIVSIAGIFLIIFGIVTLLGKGFSSFIKQRQFKHDTLGTFLFGIFFAVGWSACLGPILAGILLIAATLKSYFVSGLLLFFYSLGIFLPLFIISFFYDRYNLGSKTWVRGKELAFGKLKIHSTNLISGLLLIIAGITFIIFSGTTIVQKTITLSTEFVYELERKLFNIPYINWIGFIVLVIFVYFLYRFLRKKES